MKKVFDSTIYAADPRHPAVPATGLAVHTVEEGDTHSLSPHPLETEKLFIVGCKIKLV
jgi:hypothetical protein